MIEAQLQYDEFYQKVEPELAWLEELKMDLTFIDGRIGKIRTSISFIGNFYW